jgi:hypothetical protein
MALETFSRTGVGRVSQVSSTHPHPVVALITPYTQKNVIAIQVDTATSADNYSLHEVRCLFANATLCVLTRPLLCFAEPRPHE